MTAVAHQVTPFLTSYEVMARYHISYTTLWRRIKDGSLPQPRINRNTRNKLWPIINSATSCVVMADIRVRIVLRRSCIDQCSISTPSDLRA